MAGRRDRPYVDLAELGQQAGPMHYVIIGAGAVGGTIGGRLHQHGHRVTLVARGAHLDAMRNKGLRLATPDGEYTLDAPVAADPTEVTLTPESVLVLTVKSQDTAEALASWVDAPVRGGGTAGERLPLLCAQNGVANERAALRLFDRVYGVCVWLPATYLEPGTVLAQGHPCSGMLQIGRCPAGVADDTGDDTAAEIAAEIAASQLASRVRADVMRWKYGKLLANLGNGIGALVGIRDEELMARVRAEGTAALDAAGIAYTSRDEEIAERGELITIKPVAGQARGGSSTWQSLARGTGTVEVDYLNGEVVLLGREHGVATPVNLLVQQLVRRAARDGLGPGHMTADALRAML
jgi:2-dehydropantoate 2-reductase